MNNEQAETVPWYSKVGPDSDVVVSSRVRIARNLANFPFPTALRNDDSERVDLIVMGVFSELKCGEKFHSIKKQTLDENGILVLSERGVLEENQSAVIMDFEGNIAVSLNTTDHIKISSVASGLSFRDNFNRIMELDGELQKKLQFAASKNMGFLCSQLKDVGSGMKLSARVHLPAVVLNKKLDSIVEYLNGTNCEIQTAFPEISTDRAAGNFFQISSRNSYSGSEIDQIANFESVIKFITETERKVLTEYADNKRTFIRNSIIQSFSKAKFSLFITLREAVDIISDIKTGLRLGIVEGIDESVLCGLLLKVQKGHLQYILGDGQFDFEEDVKKDFAAQIDRLRAITLQDAFENISLGKL